MQNTLDKIQELAIATEISITQAFPSIYSKENVLVIVNQLVTEIQEIVAAQVPEKAFVGIGLLKEQQTQLIAQIYNSIDEDFDNVDADELVDFDTAEFSIEYNNQIQLDSIERDAHRFKNNIKSGIGESVKQFFEDKQNLVTDQK
jgi:hypothetical protein